MIASSRPRPKKMLPGVARAATTATIANDLPTDWRIFTPRGHPTRDLVLLTGSQVIVPVAFPDISFSARGEETASSHVTRPRIPVKIPAVPIYVRPLSFQSRSIEKHFLLCLSHFLPIIDSEKTRQKKCGEEFLGRHAILTVMALLNVPLFARLSCLSEFLPRYPFLWMLVRHLANDPFSPRVSIARFASRQRPVVA